MSENETIQLCIQILNGTVGCNMSLTLDVQSDIAKGKINAFYYDNYHACILPTEGTDFIGPTPSNLTFISGETVGATKCADFSIVDDSIPQAERNFNISITGTVGRLFVDPESTSVEFSVPAEPDDGKSLE